LGENDSLKKDIVELEVENREYIQISKNNTKRIKRLLSSISELQSRSHETSIRFTMGGKPLHLEEMEWASTGIPTEEG
jgi:hypothetical protein